MGNEKKNTKTKTYTFSAAESAFYEAGKLDGQIAAREELSEYLKSYLAGFAAEEADPKTREEIIEELNKIAQSFSQQVNGSKATLITAINAAIDSRTNLRRFTRMISFAINGAVRGWRGQ